MQCTSTVLMVRPACFGFNAETAADNYFQDKCAENIPSLQQQALLEFDRMVALLRNNQIEVLVIEDTKEPQKPDAVFPNNWFCCGKDSMTIFPMYAANRRAEKRKDIIDKIKNKTGAHILRDLSEHETHSRFLEGTGSMVCDHQHRIIYAALSERTNEQLLKEYAALTGYATSIFSAEDQQGRPIYHTNVMMCIGERFAVVCVDAINSEAEKKKVTGELELTGHEVIQISHDQMNSFAGNMLQINSKAGVPFLLMSKTAAVSLAPSQLSDLKKYARPLIADVSTIEKTGGGSVRCMVAELF